MHNVVLEYMFKMCNYFYCRFQELEGSRLSKKSGLFQIGVYFDCEIVEFIW